MSTAAQQSYSRITTNFDRVGDALLYLAEHFREQPRLEDAARVSGLSPFHFQREFTRLTGVSPKAFLGHLTLEHAKRALLRGSSVFDAALDCGLSGSSRLHDLSLKIEAMTPGEYARRGAGVTVFYGWYRTLFGSALIAMTEHGLCGLSFAAVDEQQAQLADMATRWPQAKFVHAEDESQSYGERIFGSARGGAVHVRLSGTPWQLKVWKALLEIPEGAAVAYGVLADRLCSRRAARATASAIARNPVALLIPCHRVITSTGALGGYRWGETRKRALLALEAARTSEDA